MLKETADRRELSTSTEIEGEGPEEKMIRRATGQPTRQDTKTVSRARLDNNNNNNNKRLFRLN